MVYLYIYLYIYIYIPIHLLKYNVPLDICEILEKEIERERRVNSFIFSSL